MSGKNKKDYKSDLQKFTYEALRKEIEFRREKAWRIFSWVSTILLSVMGGIIAIKSSSSWNLTCFHAALLTGAILVLSNFSHLWIHRNLEIEDNALNKIEPLEVFFKIREPNEKDAKRPMFGYHATIILLTIATLITIWVVPFT
ncbi:hypothetical protein JMN32_18250 [Fulvivirga sp. 29W222]|uniref:Uncharacterized protein n=1 Tax=Fulvivirga marina TaxID=2494733 RepID=A0A937KD58_9BACT|nr:hypothetical protein [Fulvivirga marina]MBL6448262.1 hypothetical protein [Fulvivirga marina]